MNLVQRGKLRLNQKVFGPGAILGTKYGKKPYGARVREGLRVKSALLFDQSE